MSVEDLRIGTLERELVADRPKWSAALLSRQERQRCIDRGMHALYRWYMEHSARRHWSVHGSFDWRKVHSGHSVALMNIIEGFYAVEQYAPDYTSELARLTRREYGRSQFYLRWGAEEEKHADLWRHTLVTTKARSQEELDEYTDALRQKNWTLPWRNSVQMLLYTVLQERATEIIYLNTAKVARGLSSKGIFSSDADPALAKVAATIAADEAAHYHFFLESARLYLYYLPEETLIGLADVLKAFVMPASDLVPRYDAFIRDLYDGDLFGRRKYVRDVVEPAFEKLGLRGVRELESAVVGMRASSSETVREDDYDLRAVLDVAFLEKVIGQLFQRIGQFADA